MKNWKTSLCGCLAAVMIAIAPILQTGQVDWKTLIIAALVAAFGFLSKDFNVTGGTVQQ